MNFETVDLFNLHVDYLASKITITFLFIVSMFNYRTLFDIKYYYNYLNPIIIYFGFLTLISFLNKSELYSTFFDLPFTLNIIVFVILINYSRIQPDILLKGLFFFAIGAFILAVLPFLGMGNSAELEGLEGRLTIFSLNQNKYGLNLCIALLTLTTILFDRKYRRAKIRYLLLLIFPLIFSSMVQTGSRVSLISFILGISAFIYLNKLVSSAQKIILIVSTLLTAILLWKTYLKDALVIDRLILTLKEGDLSSRDLIWNTIGDIISSNYIWGVGITGYTEIMDKSFGISSPHNVFIEVLCYTGILGLFLFVIFLYRIITSAIKRYSQNGELLPIILLCPIFGTMLSGQLFDQKIYWILFSYIAGSDILEYPYNSSNHNN